MRWLVLNYLNGTQALFGHLKKRLVCAVISVCTVQLPAIMMPGAAHDGRQLPCTALGAHNYCWLHPNALLTNEQAYMSQSYPGCFIYMCVVLLLAGSAVCRGEGRRRLCRTEF